MLHQLTAFKKAFWAIFAASAVVSSTFLIPHKINSESEKLSSVVGLNSFKSDMTVEIASLSVDDPTEQYEYKSSNAPAYISSNAVVVRDTPSDEGEVIFTLDYASKVYIMGEDINQSNGWTKIFRDKLSGFVRTDYISYDPLFASESRYIYISDKTELRSSPSFDEDNVVQILEQNNRFKQTGYNEDWIQIEDSGVNYYFEREYGVSNMIFVEEPKNIYLNRGCYLKSEPQASEDYNCIYLDKDSKIAQVEYNSTWIKLLYDNKYYYVEKQFTSPYIASYTKNSYSLTFDDTVYSGDIAVVLEKAYGFLGTSYVYGSATPYATDCSGLTMQCYEAVGVSLPHKAAKQAYYGRDVMYEDMKPGDLIMFSSRYSKTISHVGIYVGDGMMIHAADSRSGVIASDLERYCSNGGTIRAVRRIIEE